MKQDIKPLTIKEWNEEDRPREKLILKGVASLSDSELLAILIGSGNRNESAVELSKKILNHFNNNLNVLTKASINELMKFNGIGEAKAISIVTALALGKRQRLSAALSIPKITCSKDAFDIFEPILGDLPHEEFWILHVNNSNKVIDKQLISKGGLTGTLVDLRIIFKKSLELLSTAMILGHNHPSGKLQPSQADKQITQKIKNAAATLDIKVLDHLIITQKAYFSFADEGIL
ncbi:DNA repair protein RadC [Wenyingzhuangia heitensis]|uniref:DNA repair protein RadC n=1 Tax=Wenyingzhuangia heitensis TaxID=1487859 RepID=A0ABX0U801_9FLAO|nr:DNA repair protein RadC [Wenyingzhuangia heitensis]NIJ43646.1 DNA repair protein RadC [Wenyingzhuangia heitensis]